MDNTYINNTYMTYSHAILTFNTYMHLILPWRILTCNTHMDNTNIQNTTDMDNTHMDITYST